MPTLAFDEIVFRLGRGTALINAALIQAFDLLRVGGSLWVAGHNQEGIKSFAKRAEAHFGNMHLLRIKASCRLLRFQKQSSQASAPLEDPGYFSDVNLEIDIPKLGKVAYVSKPGVFSYRSTDIGTALLAKQLPDCSGLAVLDLGCGSGVLSLAACKLGAKSVLAVDVNVVATLCATKNFMHYGSPATALCTNLTEGIDSEFDIVLSNPPFHHGSETDYSFPGKILDAILPRLKPGGSVFLVANRFLDYLAQASARFQTSEVLMREHGYCVYRFVK
jgi:16S rRNA (guanine1207-N2)-methyltransferase